MHWYLRCVPLLGTVRFNLQGRIMRQVSTLVAAGIVLFSVMPATAQSGTKAGLLSCNMSPTIGLIVGSHQHIRCSFTPDAGGAPEFYSGSITRIGLDVGFRAGG